VLGRGSGRPQSRSDGGRGERDHGFEQEPDVVAAGQGGGQGVARFQQVLGAGVRWAGQRRDAESAAHQERGVDEARGEPGILRPDVAPGEGEVEAADERIRLIAEAAALARRARKTERSAVSASGTSTAVALLPIGQNGVGAFSSSELVGGRVLHEVVVQLSCLRPPRVRSQA
jgi:hypothetical protein